MSLTYRAVDWNPQKRRYDLVLGAWLAVLGAVAVGVSLWVRPNLTAETLVIRTTAVLAFALLHVLLALGPLARLDRRFLPLLYNRRHLGVTLFLLGLVHALFSLIQFHALGDEWPWVSVFTAYGRDYAGLAGAGGRFAHVPFEPFGVGALLLLGVLAITSHDFWLRNLGPVLWKALHLGVYPAYGLLLAHVALGALQGERSPVPLVLLGLGFLALAGLHLAAARQERRMDDPASQAIGGDTDGWHEVAVVADLREGRGRVCRLGRGRVALWQHRGRVFATSNVCRHQAGPLGEGRILDGCITCPWHGWTYQPEDGCSPPPFEERVATHRTRVVDDRVFVSASPNPLARRRTVTTTPKAP